MQEAIVLEIAVLMDVLKVELSVLLLRYSYNGICTVKLKLIMYVDGRPL
jgi:hypothetical protein